MSAHVEAAPLGGRLRTRTTATLAALAALGALLVVVRFALGLGAVTGLNDGYPWGLWIAFDDAIGTSLACGGFSLAIVVYVFNRGRYHPLVRSSLVTAALGYTLAGVTTLFEIGRPWEVWRLALPWEWNLSSVLLQVAICAALYALVLWVELVPTLLEGARGPFWRRVGGALERPLALALPWLLALGLVVPTMHQSAFGALLLIAPTKVHPLWYTPMLPLLFLLSSVAMGFSAVVLESAIAQLALKRPAETALLSSLARLLPPLVGAWLLLRVGDLGLRGRLPLLGESWLGWFFTLELSLPLAAAILLLPSYKQALPLSTLFRAALLVLVGGALYRFDTFLVAFDPGRGWHYFPVVPELLVTVGVVAAEVLGYVVIVKRFPILSGRPLEGAAS